MKTYKELVHPTSNESSNGYLRFGLGKRHKRRDFLGQNYGSVFQFAAVLASGGNLFVLHALP